MQKKTLQTHKSKSTEKQIERKNILTRNGDEKIGTHEQLDIQEI